MRIEIVLPIKIVSELNLREHWSVKNRRHKKLHKRIRLAFLPYSGWIDLPCCVTIIRVSPRTLDYVNFIGSLKSIQDYIADQIIPGLAMGRADGDPRITWIYMQEKSAPKTYACKIIIEDTK